MMWVIKLGGSFYNSSVLPDWINIISQYGEGKVILVPGGGPFADQVRQAQKQHKFNDKIAHQMALHAMDQFGLLLIGIAEKYGYKWLAVHSEQEIKSALENKCIPVWLPSKKLENNTNIPQNWNITSDSLSAWLARELNANYLLLIKQCGSHSISKLEALENKNIVDNLFETFIAGTEVSCKILYADESSKLSDLLQNNSSI